ncbi:MAG: helix-turn-helix transcriptional regulator [Candidatus Synoicihabitans palmerolidicus]|nr:helix-turn-helix transcriptional regulator [Candidatus Synoicihabitans palmerolidicus]
MQTSWPSPSTAQWSITDPSGDVVFTTRLAESLLHRHCADYQIATKLPPSLDRPDNGLTLRRFTEPGRYDLSFFILEEKAPSPNPSALLKLGLTAREAEVLWWIAQGKSNPDIATILGAAVRTIHKHVENVFRKLGCETRAAAAVTAQDALRPGSGIHLSATSFCSRACPIPTPTDCPAPPAAYGA